MYIFRPYVVRHRFHSRLILSSFQIPVGTHVKYEANKRYFKVWKNMPRSRDTKSPIMCFENMGVITEIADRILLHVRLCQRRVRSVKAYTSMSDVTRSWPTKSVLRERELRGSIEFRYLYARTPGSAKFDSQPSCSVNRGVPKVSLSSIGSEVCKIEKIASQLFLELRIWKLQGIENFSTFVFASRCDSQQFRQFFWTHSSNKLLLNL